MFTKTLKVFGKVREYFHSCLLSPHSRKDVWKINFCYPDEIVMSFNKKCMHYIKNKHYIKNNSKTKRGKVSVTLERENVFFDRFR